MLLGNVCWCFHMMANMGSPKDWEIGDGLRSGKKPRVLRQAI